MKILKYTGFFSRNWIEKTKEYLLKQQKCKITSKVSTPRIFSPVFYSDTNVNDKLNKAITENEVVYHMKKIDR